MKSTVQDLLERRSIRKYKPEQITFEELETVLVAGTYAATGRNLQDPLIVAVQDKEEIALMSRLNAQYWPMASKLPDPFYGAPTVIVVFADPDSPFYMQDSSLVIGNMMIAAHAIGLGSCWVQRAKEVFETDEGKALKKKWGIDDKMIGFANCIVGYPDEAPKASPRKEGYYKLSK